jgi:transcriptional regulator with XRE-family HTH domain
METVQNVGQLGKLIRAVRIHAGLTQADAAALCGVSAPFLNGVERGKLTAQVGGIFAVCRGLGIRICLDPPAPIDELKAAPPRKPRRRRR